MPTRLQLLNREIIHCTRCPRLIQHCQKVAREKRRAYMDWDYWGKPVPGFGDPTARVFVIGLAPGAHGANRTGRMFTGDRSGEWLYRALYETGFASQPESERVNDGLKLHDLYITASARCAPPDNKPLPRELANCRPYLERELELFRNIRVVIALGGIAFKTYLGILKDQGAITKIGAYRFGHNELYDLGTDAKGKPLPKLLGSYHPSQQNTSTGRLTREMLNDVFDRARILVAR